jgi:hypothetical protein
VRRLAALASLCAVLFAAWVLKHLSYPLLWNDEAETAMYAERILEFGYPKVHDGRNVVFELERSRSGSRRGSTPTSAPPGASTTSARSGPSPRAGGGPHYGG